MIDLKYSLVIEATGIQISLDFSLPSCRASLVSGIQLRTVCTGQMGMEEHLALLEEQRLPVPDQNPNPTGWYKH